MLRKIKLHGELAEFLGQDEFEAVVKTTAEAVKFLITNFPKLEAYMSNRYYQVIVGDNELDKDQIHDPVGKSEIHFVPVISGAGGSSFQRILIGGALIGASFLFPGAGIFGKAGAELTGGVVTGFAAKVGTAISTIGGAMVLSGVTEYYFHCLPQMNRKMIQEYLLIFLGCKIHREPELPIRLYMEKS